MDRASESGIIADKAAIDWKTSPEDGEAHTPRHQLELYAEDGEDGRQCFTATWLKLCVKLS
jgi:hypothetical protein